jgi:hypothetical protein
MSEYANKNLLFYSNRDQASLAFLTELVKNPLLDSQFIKICVNDPRVKIPQIIRQYNKIPVVVCPGFDKPILGEAAFTWLQNNAFGEKGNGLDFGNIQSATQLSNDSSRLVNESQNTEYNQYHNNDYNLGFATDKREVNSQFSDLNKQGADQTRIPTFEESSNKRDAKVLLDERIESLKFVRDNEFGHPKRTGGIDNFGSGSSDSGKNRGSPQFQPSSGMNTDPLGAQISAFGNMGSNLEMAYQPITDGKSAKQSGPNTGPRAPTYTPSLPAVPQMGGGSAQIPFRPHPNMLMNNRPNDNSRSVDSRSMFTNPSSPNRSQGIPQPSSSGPNFHQL